MRARFKARNPEKVEFTAEITMTLEQWVELRGQLAEKWPATKLSGIISDMVYQAERSFLASEDAPDA